jgi:tRNA pseudouridine55 synthase
VEGLLYVDKPAGITSHDVVAIVRRAARSKRVGHAGTLDPFATGLLVLAIGAYTRLLPYVNGEPKVYRATVRFGFETDTDDSTGKVTVEKPAPDFRATDALQAAIGALTGTIEQIPPAFSAKHVDGVRAYKTARRGGEVTLAPVQVVVHSWHVEAVAGDRVEVEIVCAGGTYIRALARDLGRAMNSAAHCETLRRVASGSARVDDAITMDRLAPGSIADGSVALQPPLPMLGDIAQESLDDAALRDVLHGRTVAATRHGVRAALLRDDRVVGIAMRTADDRWQPKVVLAGDGDA